jgi:hypothetical protein
MTEIRGLFQTETAVFLTGICRGIDTGFDEGLIMKSMINNAYLRRNSNMANKRGRLFE